MRSYKAKHDFIGPFYDDDGLLIFNFGETIEYCLNTTMKCSNYIGIFNDHLNNDLREIKMDKPKYSKTFSETSFTMMVDGWSTNIKHNGKPLKITTIALQLNGFNRHEFHCNNLILIALLLLPEDSPLVGEYVLKYIKEYQKLDYHLCGVVYKGIIFEYRLHEKSLPLYLTGMLSIQYGPEI